MSKPLWVGLDVGSTTVKLALVEPEDSRLIHQEYARHNAEQSRVIEELMEDAHRRHPERDFHVVLCGSGAPGIAKTMGAHFIQEVVANALAIKAFHRDVRTAIELGGQDAKVIFFRRDPETGQLTTSDMRMNGSCAGGTGAFIDQIAELLHVPSEEFEAMAAKGKTVYDISGRCGVFAKTDIQPLLNQGVSRADIALSSFHAIAKQTIGGLAQGMEMRPRIIFEGGPLTFNPTLVRVFKERLGLDDDDVVVPDHPETIVAYGAALSAGAMFADKPQGYRREGSLAALREKRNRKDKVHTHTLDPFFRGEAERQAFSARYPLPDFLPREFEPGTEVPVFLGIDAGSTTTKFVLTDEEGEMINRFYANNQGEPLAVFRDALIEMRDFYRERGVHLRIRGAGTTGYGEVLCARGVRADYHTVETVSPARAAREYAPEATFILDIGGQDMKAINLQKGIVTGIVLNEACSAGCGSFVETYARSLGIPVEEIGERAFRAEHPSRLGSRCTVFMNSSIITEQKNGKTTEDILAGICQSIIENVFTKVVRVSSMDELGPRIVVQGGTFKNDAVLRAMERYTGREVVRPPFPGEMGALGIALLTREHILNREKKKGRPLESEFLSLDSLEDFSYEKQPGLICPFCSNNCSRTVIYFSTGEHHVTGNRCERGEILGDAADSGVKERLKSVARKKQAVPDMMTLRRQLLFQDYLPKRVSPEKKLTIGIPRTLEFWNSMPFWKAFWEALGYQVQISRRSSRKLFERGLPSIPSDTVCFPAKLAHGHILDLIDKGVDRIFMPMMNRMPPENEPTKSFHMCAVVKGYPMVLRTSDEPEERHGIPFDTPTFHWLDQDNRNRQIYNYFHRQFGLGRRELMEAVQEGDRAMSECSTALKEEGRRVMAELRREGKFGVVLAGRPYHGDELVNHSLAGYFVQRGIPVLTLDALPGLEEEPVGVTRAETTINFHVRLLAGASYAARHPELELVQIVSFGCGHDAVLTDEIIRIMREKAGKEPLILKLDESDNPGPLAIRITSFLETVQGRRERQIPGRGGDDPEPGSAVPSEPFRVKFTEADKAKTILVPNVTRGFAKVISAAIRRQGYKVEPLDLADDRALALGKKYVHNDMCFPAQVNIGEFLASLDRGDYQPEEVVFGLAKDHCDCRLAQYAAVARKALDSAGYPEIPMITTGQDTKNMYPDFSLGTLFEIRMVWGVAALDVLESLRRRIRPYEAEKGQTDELFEAWTDRLAEAMELSIRRYLQVLSQAVDAFSAVPLRDEPRRPRVFVIGEFLLNFHPGSNNFIERYLEDNGMEVLMPNMLYNFHRESIREIAEMREIRVRYPALQALASHVSDRVCRMVVGRTQRIASRCPLYQPPRDFNELSDRASHIIHKTFTSGEGWMIAAEILEHAGHGVDSFLILQPFGCLPNHVTGRGLVKAIKKEMPHIQVLALDYDPDTSFANVENRLQMLIINAKERAREKAAAGAADSAGEAQPD